VVARAEPDQPDFTLARAGQPGRLTLADRGILARLPRAAPARRRWPWVAPAAASALVVALLAFPAALLPAPAERALGRLVARSAFAGEAVCVTPAGQAALDGMAARLAQAAGLSAPLIVEVRDAPAVNAFALPGGRVVVLRGLLARMRSLAAIE
jgi:Zn-dependent protease with chaperone function